MRIALASSTLFCVLLAAGCIARGPARSPDRFVDIRFPAGKAASGGEFPHAIDGTGALWYIDGATIVRKTGPARRETLELEAARSGTLFWYDGAMYVLPGDGSGLIRVDRRLRSSSVDVPKQFVPIVGAIADTPRRAILIAQSSPTQMAVVDVWRWYAEALPAGIEPLAMAVAGGPHGKHYLIVGDRRQPLVLVKNRWSGNVAFVRTPSNTCFDGGSALDVPVDVRGRDDDRAWIASGTHLVSLDLRTKKALRVWNLGGCAMQIVAADGDRVLVATSATAESGGGYVTEVVRVDRGGVRDQPQYGRLAGLSPGFTLDRFDRLWWYDAKTKAFICRTPVSD